MKGTTSYDGACECGGLIEADPDADEFHANVSREEQESDRDFTVRAEEVNAEIDDFIEEENREWMID